MASSKSLKSVRRFIQSLLRCREHDDGSLAPLMLRFAWHSCGTYDWSTNTGGSNGATILLESERGDQENRGFEKAYDILKKVKAKFGPLLSNADVIVLCGTVAIETMNGPKVPFCYGRVDYSPEDVVARSGTERGGCPFGDGSFNPCGSRLPPADVGKTEEYSEPRLREKPTIEAVKSCFGRMGLDTKETVCLILLGHQFGRCHPEVSGYDHAHYPFDPTHWNAFDNGMGFLSVLRAAGAEGGRYEEVLSSMGKRQFVMDFGGASFMLLISDMVLHWDPEYRSHLEWYDKNRGDFRADVVGAWQKLTELGCDGLLTREE